MKIAEVVSTFPPDIGGMSTVSFYNARELARRGHDVTVFTIQYQRSVYEPGAPDFKIIRLRSPLVYGAGAVLPQLYFHLKHFDIIHLHYPFFGGAEYVYLASLIRRQKYFLTYHCDAFGDSPARTVIINLYERALLKRIMNRASGIGALSLGHFHSTRASSLADPAKLMVVPNGVDTDIFHPRERDFALVERYRLQNKKVVLFVGRLQECKGLDVLIDAVAMIRNQDLVLLIVGGGYSAAAYRRQAESKGIQERVIFAGPVDYTMLPSYYSLCDFLVLPSTYMESFGMVILEAMASGKPVIASSLPGPSSLITEGVDGYISPVNDRVDLKDKIESLMNDPIRCREMGRAGCEKVMRDYSWLEIGLKLENQFKALMK